MPRSSLQTIRDEHAALGAMLRSLSLMLERGPGDAPEKFFDVLRAMLFYIDEFPERLHHPKETQILFPHVLRLAPETADTLAKLEKDHAGSEMAVRELQHLLLAWELVGESRHAAFANAATRYVENYLAHMRLEEAVVLPAAQRVFSNAEWVALDAAFATNCDPLTGKTPRNPVFNRLFTRIVMRAPAPIGVGAD